MRQLLAEPTPINVITNGKSLFRCTNIHANLTQDVVFPSPAMALNEVFIDYCFNGDLQGVERTIASQNLTPEDLEEGLAAATEQSHPDVVSILFNVGATITETALYSLPGNDLGQDPLVIRHYLDHGLDPNALIDGSEPLLWYASYSTLPTANRERPSS